YFLNQEEGDQDVESGSTGVFLAVKDNILQPAGLLALTDTGFLAEAQSLVWLLYIANPQQGDLRHLGPLSGQGADSGARTRDRSVCVDLRADSLTSVLPTPPPCPVKRATGKIKI
ncbi:hypothetical protein PoB_001325900, partial [Plakobranchus ocellatus]